MQTCCPYCMRPTVDGQTRCTHCERDLASYQPSVHHLPPGTLLHERYRIGRVLGEGGFGITYLGWDTNLDRMVAVKEYFPTSFVLRETSVSLEVTCYTSQNQDFYAKGREQFLKEARTMARLDRVPQIVRVLDFFPEHNTAYIVMEFLEGETLKERTARQGPIPAAQLLALMEPVLRGMETMHAAGIIHRDISPDNLMVLSNQSVKLMDFGCARDLEGGHTMTVTLKHGFAPMEQYTGRGQGPWSDVYALSATLYYCLTGKVPPRSVERSDGVEDLLVPPSKLGAALTPAQEQSLCKGLAVRAKDRWQSAAAFYQGLYGRSLNGQPLREEPPQTEYLCAGAEIPAPAAIGLTEAAVSDAAESATQQSEARRYREPLSAPAAPAAILETTVVSDGPTAEESPSDALDTRESAPAESVPDAEAVPAEPPRQSARKSLPRSVKAGLGAAACLAVVLLAVASLGGSPREAAPVQDAQHALQDTSGSASLPDDAPEDAENVSVTEPLPEEPVTEPAESAPSASSDAQDAQDAPQQSTPQQGTSQGSSAPAQSTSNESEKPASGGTSKPSQESAPATQKPAATAEELYRSGKDAYNDGDLERAVSLLQQADDQGAADAAYLLAECGHDFWTEQGNADRAVSVLRDAHSRGASNAGASLYSIGQDYYNTRQFEKAAPLYQEAANWGYSGAMYGLYLLYSYGEGVPQSDTTAFSWLMKSVEAGNPVYAVVGINYLYGYGVEKDREEARKWFQKAADAGDYDGQYYLDQMDQGLI